MARGQVGPVGLKGKKDDTMEGKIEEWEGVKNKKKC